jgi:hypothetical protein
MNQAMKEITPNEPDSEEEIYGPDGPTWLELFQDMAEVDDGARKSLEEIYRNPDLMAAAMDIPGREQRSPEKTNKP